MHEPASAVTVLANSQCPHCVQAVERVTDWAIEEGIAVAGIDLVAHPEAAGWFGTEASPVLVFDAAHERVHVGLPTHEAFHHLCVDD